MRQWDEVFDKRMIEQCKKCIGKVLIVLLVVVGCDIGCPWFEIFGVLCPCCGVTRAWICLFQGEIKRAFCCNAFFLLIPAFSLIYVCREYIAMQKRKLADCCMYVFAGLLFCYSILRLSGMIDIPR